MKRETIAVGELMDYVGSETYAHLRQVPISPLRAWAQSQNPDADGNDIALILYTEGGQVIAYRGLVPVGLVGGSRAVLLSGIWVQHDYRGQGLGHRLVEEPYQAWQGCVLATDMAPAMIHINEALGYYQYDRQLRGHRFYLRSMLAGRRQRRGQHASGWARATDRLLNSLSRPEPIGTQGYSLQTTDPDTALAYSAPYCQQDYVPKTLARLHWRELPWLSRTLQCDRYHFSCHCPDYRAGWYLAQDASQTAGAVRLLVRQGELKIKYVYGPKENHPLLARLIIHLGHSWKVNSLLCLDLPLSEALCQQADQFIYHRPQEQPILVGGGLQLPAGLQWQVGDLDSNFT
jgi:GNAT superfamily N-acetyltransferase